MAEYQRPRMERILEPPNDLGSNGLAVFLSWHEGEWKACLSDVSGEAVFVDMADVDEVIATLAACRWMVDRNRAEIDMAREGFAEMARQRSRGPGGLAASEG